MTVMYLYSFRMAAPQFSNPYVFVSPCSQTFPTLLSILILIYV